MKDIELRKVLENGKVDGLDINLIDEFAYNEDKLNEFTLLHENPYSKIIMVLVHIQKDEDEAKNLWEKIINNLKNLEEKLERKVGITIASFDYLQNIEKDEVNLKIFNENNLNVLMDMSMTDELTKLYSKDILDVFLNKMFADAYRNENLFCLIMIDVDNFEIINDIYGREKGDEILEEISNMILENIRKMDIAFRYGDDELAILFPRATKQQAYRVMENLRISIRKRYEDKSEATISIGISENTGFVEVEDIIKNANKKLQEAKKRGKNKTRY